MKLPVLAPDRGLAKVCMRGGGGKRAWNRFE
jgi:hypothetical protein